MDDMGWVKLHRKINKWGWFDDLIVYKLFTTLIMMANYEAKEWHGITIGVGSVVSSVENLAKESSLSKQQVRTALKKLESTHDIKRKSTRKYTIINICNYCVYQGLNVEEQHSNNTVSTHNQHTTNTQITTTKEDKESKEEKNNNVDSNDPVELFFDSLWKLYPRKEGKSSVNRIHKEEIYRIGYDRMAKAIEKYKSTVEGRDPKYVKMGSSFFNTNYVDYLEEDVTEQKVDPAPEEDEEEEMSDEDWLKMMRERYGE